MDTSNIKENRAIHANTTMQKNVFHCSIRSKGIKSNPINIMKNQFPEPAS